MTVAVVLTVLTLSGVGAYLRINGASDAEADTSTATTDLPAVSAADQFSTAIAIPVEVAEVTLDTLVLTVNAAAEAASRQQTTVRSQVSGEVRAVRVAENQNVGAQAVLIEIDPTEYQLALAEAQAQLQQAEARYQELTLGADQFADSTMRAEQDSAAVARSGLPGARVAVTRAEINLARTRVVAPFAGRIANLEVVPGQYVSAGDELLTVQVMDPIRVDAQVLESEIGHLETGRPARVTFSAFPGEVFEGRIETINPFVDQQTRMARVRVIVRNPDGRILPGMYANAVLAARRYPDRILVPRAALLERSRRNMLFVFSGEGSEGRAEWRYVNPGRMNDTHVELLEEGPEDGIALPGERVLVAGHRDLTHDAVIRVVENVLGAEGGRVR